MTPKMGVILQLHRVRDDNFLVVFRTGDIFYGKTGRATKFCPNNWTGAKKNLADGRPRIIARPFIRAGVYHSIGN